MSPIVSKHASQTSDYTDGSLLLHVGAENNSNDQGWVPGMAVLPNLNSPITKNSPYIALSDVIQQYTKMRCYFHSHQNHFLDYISEHVLDGTVIFVGDILFWYSEREGTYTEFLENPTENVSWP